MRVGFELSANVKLTKCQQTLFEHITEICRMSPDRSCFKSIKNMAKDCGMAVKTAQEAKHKLLDYKLITVKEFPNGKRKNKRHKIELNLPKVVPRNKLQYERREYRERVRWEDFDKYSAEYVNSLSKLDQIDLYTELGLRVIPIHFFGDGECSCLNHHCTKPAKHPAVRWKNYNEELKTSDKFWRRCAANLNYNVGILLPEDVVIVDVDTRRQGHVALEYLQEELGELPVTLTTRSGGGGLHAWYLLPPELKIQAGTDALSKGIDVLISGLLVVAPPSVHLSGNSYSWLHFSKPVELPEDYLLSLSGDVSGESGIDEGCKAPAYELPERIYKDFRRPTLFRYGCYLRGVHAATREQILHALRRENENRCTPMLTERQLQLITKCCDKYSPNSVKDSKLSAA